MYFLNKFCCICLNKSDLKHLFEVDNDGLSHYNKLTSSIAEMNFIEMNDQRLICGECCVTLNTVYNFRQMCLRSKANLITHISQLQTFSHSSGTLSVRLKDIKPEIEVSNEEICIKYENKATSSSFEDSNPVSEIKTESYEESIQFPASVKEESEDCAAHEDATVDRMNEGTHCDVNVKVEHPMEDEHQMVDPYIEFRMIDIADHLLAAVKEEPTTDSETPQDGSTSPRPLNIHMQVHSKNKPYACGICKRSFARRRDLPRHMRMHTGEKPYVCQICNKNFTQKSNLKVHLQRHSGERPYQCEMCKKSFTLKNTLIRHMVVHSNEINRM